MYANIFTDINYAEIAKRLKSLTADANRKWGTMTPAEMLRHCRAQIDFVLDPKDTKILKTAFRFGPVRWVALYGPQWPKNSPTAPQMDVKKGLKDIGEFDNELKLLLEGLHTLVHTGHVEATHPLFGKMGKGDWGRVVWKHLDHHLRQFGC